MGFQIVTIKIVQKSPLFNKLYWDAEDIRCLSCDRHISSEYLLHVCKKQVTRYVPLCSCAKIWRNPPDFF